MGVRLSLSPIILAVVPATATCGQTPPPRVIVPEGTEWVAAGTEPRTLTFTADAIRITLTDIQDGADISVSVEQTREGANACAVAQNVSAQHDIVGRGPHNIHILTTLGDTLTSFGSLCSVDVSQLRSVAQRKLDMVRR